VDKHYIIVLNATDFFKSTFSKSKKLQNFSLVLRTVSAVRELAIGDTFNCFHPGVVSFRALEVRGGSSWRHGHKQVRACLHACLA